MTTLSSNLARGCRNGAENESRTVGEEQRHELDVAHRDGDVEWGALHLRNRHDSMA